MGIFSALIGNAGVVSLEDLIRDYGKLLTEGEAIDLNSTNRSVYDVQKVLAHHVLK